MADFKFSIEEVVDNAENLANMIEFMRDNYVLIGIPQAKTHRKGDPITNAELLFIHTNGSPVNHIPARPVIEPAIRNDTDRLTRMMAKAAKEAADGNYTAAMQSLNLVGMRGQNDAREWFTNPKNGWAPNSPRVQAAKLAKHSTEPRPLIDTGELRRSIIYVVVKEGKR